MMWPFSGWRKSAKPALKDSQESSGVSTGKRPRRRSRRQLDARFDLARTNSSNQNYYTNADRLSARAALDPGVRAKCRQRSRYEAESNSWYAGMLETAAYHIVGKGGPTLQVLTDNQEVNKRIEAAWAKHAKRMSFVAKLRLTVETDWRDGETVKLRTKRADWQGIDFDVRIYEADQLASPLLYPHPTDRNWDDGIRLDDDTGEPLMYHILDAHPGDNFYAQTPWKGEWYPACNVIHTFRRIRPGQLRGIPRATAGLPLLPYLRRYKKATLTAAENAARMASYITTNQSAQVQPAKSPQDFAQIDMPDGATMFLPEGWMPNMLKPEHPTTVEEQFIRSSMTEFTRCTGMPLHIALGTSKDSNFSSANLDVRLSWQCVVDSERDRLEEQDCNKQFMWFLEDAVFVPGLLDGAPPIDQIQFGWNWPPLPVTDPTEAATASELLMASGQSAPSTESAKNGQPYSAETARAAADHGVSVEEYLALVRYKRFGVAYPPAAVQAEKPGSTQTTEQVASQPFPGEFGGINRRQWQNNTKAIRDVLNDLANGVSTPGYARVLLESLGLSAARAEALLKDAVNGVVDDPELTEVTP